MESVPDEIEKHEEEINKDFDTDLAPNIDTTEAALECRRNNKIDDRNAQGEKVNIGEHVMASDPTVPVAASLLHEVCTTLNSLRDLSVAGMAQMQKMNDDFNEKMQATNDLLSRLIQIVTVQPENDSFAVFRNSKNIHQINELQAHHWSESDFPKSGPLEKRTFQQNQEETQDARGISSGDNRHAPHHSDIGGPVPLDGSTESRQYSSVDESTEQRSKSQEEVDQGVMNLSNNRELGDAGDRSNYERVGTVDGRFNNEQNTTVHSEQSRDGLKQEKGSSDVKSVSAKISGQRGQHVGQTSTASADQPITDHDSVTVFNVHRDSQPVDARPKKYDQRQGSDNSWKSDQKGSKGISALGLTLTSSSDTETTRLHEALDRAQLSEDSQSPKAKSFDTVLCLDISSSMWSGGAFDQMMKTVNTFIDGIEDAAAEVEENIAVVTFGVQADVIQHLTNDFSRVRDAIARIEVGGKSPFFEAMVVCLTAISGKGGTISVSGEYDVHPRIIFFTDGHITEGSYDPEANDRVTDATNTRANFSRLMMDLSPKRSPSMPHPIIFVPVGEHADRVFLESQATLNESQIVEAEDILSLCQYFKVQETIGKVVVCLRNQDSSQTDGGQIRALVQALVPSISDQEMEQVIQAVNKEMQRPGREKTKRVRPTDFDEVFEDTDGVQCGDRLPLGTRVVRGPDWRWGNQDGGKPGTVVQHEESRHPFTWVLWDTGEWNRYPYGTDMGYHIWKTTEWPVLQSDGQLQVGMTVQKAPSLESKPGTNVGVIIRKSKDGKKVKVRWENSIIEACAAEDVVFRDPFEQDEEQEQTLRKELFGHSSEEEDVDDEKVWVWQWRDDWGNWHLYSSGQMDQLEKEYSRRKTGTCIIQRDGKNFRVMFNRMAERECERGLERNVQRTKITLEDLYSLEEAERLSTN